MILYPVTLNQAMTHLGTFGPHNSQKPVYTRTHRATLDFHCGKSHRSHKAVYIDAAGGWTEINTVTAGELKELTQGGNLIIN